MAKFYGIIINGKGGVGKDDFVKICMNNPEYETSMFYNISLVDEIKRIAKTSFGWNGKDKSDKGRKFLSDLFVASKEYNNFPLTNMEDKLRNLYKVHSQGDKEVFIFVHAREPRDINYLKSFMKDVMQFDNVKTLLIRRPDMDDKYYGNVGDDGVFGYEYDHVYVRPKARETERKKLDYEMFKRICYTGTFKWGGSNV